MTLYLLNYTIVTTLIVQQWLLETRYEAYYYAQVFVLITPFSSSMCMRRIMKDKEA